MKQEKNKRQLKGVVVVMLAGGIGKRFDPFVTNKSCFPFFGKPLIIHNLEFLKKAGFDEVVVVGNKKVEEILGGISAFKSLNNMRIKIVNQSKPLGMADALLKAEGLIGGKSIFVLNSADIVDESLLDLMIGKFGEKILVCGKKMRDYFPGGYLVFKNNDKNDDLVGIIEKPGKGNEPSDLVNLVFHFFPDSKEFLDKLKSTSSDFDDVYEKSLTKLISEKKAVVVEYDNYWQAVKYPWQVLDMAKLFLKKRLKFSNNAKFVSKLAEVDDTVYLGKGVKILSGAVVKGASYIGDNTVIGNNSLVRDSIIESNCVIGFGSEVARSYVGEGCHLHSNYVGDSVLEKNVAMGAYALTANFRLDEENVLVRVKGAGIDTGSDKLGALIAGNVRVGVNSSIMPGVKVGSNVFIGPGLIIKADIGKNKRVFDKQELIIKPLNKIIIRRK